MKILITGADGFVGRNLSAALDEIRKGNDKRPDHAIEELSILRYDIGNRVEELDAMCRDCDFVLHFAGVNRPKDDSEFYTGNVGFSETLLGFLKKRGNRCPIVVSSSVQASLTGRYEGSEYGKSKRDEERLFFEYSRLTGAPVYIYRFPNLFGKWCRPNYNSAIATFCHNIANGLSIRVDSRTLQMTVVYIDDLVEEMICAIRGEAHPAENGYYAVPTSHETTLGEIADTISSFDSIRRMLSTPKLDDGLTRKLYATYLSYLPAEKMISDLKMNIDARGSFTELIRTPDRGQFSVNISKPSITKGNHWHNSKNERFIVVKGEGLIRLRRIDADYSEIIEYRVSGDRLQVVETVPGYTHSIVNSSDSEELVTFIWADEQFDPERPDTFFCEVGERK